jgi:hypothetical protein
VIEALVPFGAVAVVLLVAVLVSLAWRGSETPRRERRRARRHGRGGRHRALALVPVGAA